MKGEKPVIRPAARRVIEAMRLVRHLNKEITTHNIAGVLGIKVQTVGAQLQKMVKEGLIRRHGMVLQFDGNNRAKNMLWRINTLYVRKLEKQDDEQREQGKAIHEAGKAVARATGAVFALQGAKGPGALLVEPVRDAEQLVQGLPQGRVKKALARVLHDNQAEAGR